MKIRKMHHRTLRRMANAARQELPILPSCEFYSLEVEFLLRMLEKAYEMGFVEANGKKAPE